MIKKASLLTACSVTAFSAWAQDTSPDTLVVTANRFEQPRSTVLAPTTVVTRQDIDRWQSTSVNDVLRRLPGVEATANFDTGPLTHTVSYDYVDARNAITDTPLLRRAKQQVKYQLDWQLYDFDWGITYQYLGTRYDKDYSSYPYQTVKMGGVSLWDLAVAYPVTSHLTVRGKIANLFDKDYETVYGYQTAGREYTLSGSYTF